MGGRKSAVKPLLLRVIIPTSALLLTTLTATIYAQTILRDYRATDPSVTPALGRGFSLATNTYQSICLSEIKLSEPSYDFNFILKEDTENKQTVNQWESANSNTWSNSQTTTKQRNRNSQRWSNRNEVNQQTNQGQTNKNERTTRYLEASLVVSTYYASIDEASSPLSPAAAILLQSEDAPGFFAACGTYYVRGISRRAEYKARFVFESQSNENASEIFQNIKHQVSASYSMSDRNVSHDVSWGRSRNSSKQSAKRNLFKNANLKIYLQGIGIGKDNNAALIVSNLEEYRQALKKAFIAMQAPETGRVTSVELGAWAENVEFQTRLRMQQTDLTAKNRRRIPLYKKKDILTFNAEFLAEMNRTLRQRQERYYLARECRNQILSLLSENLTAQSKRRVLNLSTQKPGITLGELNKELSAQRVEDLFNKDYMVFLTGKENNEQLVEEYWDTQENASASSYTGCIDSILNGREQTQQDLETDSAMAKETRMNNKKNARQQWSLAGKGLYLRRWNTYPGCRTLQKFFVPIKDELLINYCLPILPDQKD